MRETFECDIKQQNRLTSFVLCVGCMSSVTNATVLEVEVVDRQCGCGCLAIVAYIQGGDLVHSCWANSRPRNKSVFCVDNQLGNHFVCLQTQAEREKLIQNC